MHFLNANHSDDDDDHDDDTHDLLNLLIGIEGTLLRHEVIEQNDAPLLNDLHQLTSRLVMQTRNVT